MTDDLQTWSEVPRIAHFCSLFRKAFDLLEFDIQDLEEGLLLLEDDERLFPQLVVKLLKGCSRTFTKNVNQNNYNKYLRRLFISKAEEAEEDEVDYDFECEEFIERSVNFENCSLRNRVTILHQLCEFRLDGEDVSDKVKNLEASSLRVEPLGKDSEGFTYWYFYGTRLYKEASTTTAPSSLNDDNYADSTPSPPTWSVACLTLQDWIDLTNKMRHSKKKHDKDLSRAEQEEKDRVLAEKYEDDQQLDEDYDEKNP
ncbi:Cat eye syndrome critical region protein 2 homolog,Cat eye syndrome critical region protein 2 [Lepeophtheirus salmonis]|uniref:Cat eye syndrome critical region protein 2 homolog,Cat eye syndrome critical region protein 2 n=1 Tax=Lepeophtheirus salmonis TaxID=72036 RepID=A0A7R8CTG0_LEPSM|nr:Cat eye syndrome critical region protein 2 homolog,Cat eye syndrome critical region protein 2 [Lepeophtheirus salmonis]CAF2924009.1 Cat eye syndrome critical region protein 2 homolog,Cat eye syndrome critical region protein 2 [Lepeophtheirus salmonis]